MTDKMTQYEDGMMKDRDRTAAIHCIAELVCKHTPHGHVIRLCFEDGAACVELYKDGVGFITLPDSADKTLLEQLNDALCVANGWQIET